MAACLQRSGSDVTLVARGGQFRTIRETGLLVVTPEQTWRATMPVVESLAGWAFRSDAIVLLAVKCQDVRLALVQLVRARAPLETPIVILGNGLEGERAALRLFRNVYGACLMCPASYLSPGVIQGHCAPVPGVVDLGRYPMGIDEVTEAVSMALSRAGFQSQPRYDIVRWKWGKLLINVVNAVEAICGPAARSGHLADEALAEARACLAAAGLEFVDPSMLRARERDCLPDIGELRARSPGGSSWQSLQRATGSIETDFINGEIVLLGRMWSVPTPVNEVLQRVAVQMALDRAQPGTVSESDLVAAARDQKSGAYLPENQGSV